VLQAGGDGVTRDISATGVFFKTQAAVSEGESIDFSIEFEDAGGKHKWTLACSARVIRVERGSDGFGVAAKITESRLASEACP